MTRRYAWYLWYMLTAVVCQPIDLDHPIDLSHTYRDRVTTCWVPRQRFAVFDFQRQNLDSNVGPIVTESFATPEHCGTHLDAPYHFNQAGWKLEEIPFQRMIAEGKYIRKIFTRTQFRFKNEM